VDVGGQVFAEYESWLTGDQWMWAVRCLPSMKVDWQVISGCGRSGVCQVWKLIDRWSVNVGGQVFADYESWLTGDQWMWVVRCLVFAEYESWLTGDQWMWVVRCLPSMKVDWRMFVDCDFTGVWWVESCGTGIVSDRNHSRYSQVSRRRWHLPRRQDTRHSRAGMALVSLLFKPPPHNVRAAALCHGDVHLFVCSFLSLKTKQFWAMVSIDDL